MISLTIMVGFSLSFLSILTSVAVPIFHTYRYLCLSSGINFNSNFMRSIFVIIFNLENDNTLRIILSFSILRARDIFTEYIGNTLCIQYSILTITIIVNIYHFQIFFSLVVSLDFYLDFMSVNLKFT